MLRNTFFLSLFALASAAAENTMVCVNDQSVSFAQGVMEIRADPEPGSAAIIDMGSFPPKVRMLRGVPCSVSGPPTSVAKVPGRNLAIVTNPLRAERQGSAWQHVPDRTISFLWFEPGEPPLVVGRFQEGLQPTSISISPDGQTAAIANRAEGTLSLLPIAAFPGTKPDRITICDPQDDLVHVEFSPDGRHAVATLNAAGAIVVLSLEPGSPPEITQRILHGQMPFSARFLPDGKSLAVTDIGTDEISLYQFENGRASHIVDLPVGHIPKGLDVSPDGKWIATSCMEGARVTDKNHPKFGQPATVHLFRQEDGVWKPSKVLDVEGGPEFAVFSPDSKHLIVSNTRFRQLAFYRVDDGAFTDTGYRLPLDGEPAAIAR